MNLDAFFEKQLEVWEDARSRFAQLKGVSVKRLHCGRNTLRVQFNPARIVSTGAKVDAKTLEKRKCFLCESNRPAVQISERILHKYDLLVNPFPILSRHFTIPQSGHVRQSISDTFADMLEIARMVYPCFVFYNGPLCGASAPDHMHFQAGSGDCVPLVNDWADVYKPACRPVCVKNEDEGGVYVLDKYVCPVIVLRGRSQECVNELFASVYGVMPIPEGQYEPMMNVITFVESRETDHREKEVNEDTWVTLIIPRDKHRPDCYFRDGNEKMLVSPGALDVAGLIITPRLEDFERMDAIVAESIIQECGMSQAAFAELVSLIGELE